MRFDINKIQAEFDKEKTTLETKHKAVFNAMKSCSVCKETETKFIPCKAHMDELKAIGEAMGNLNMQTQLKVQMHPVEMQKIVEAQTKQMMEAMQKRKGKPNSCTDESCQACQ